MHEPLKRIQTSLQVLTMERPEMRMTSPFFSRSIFLSMALTLCLYPTAIRGGTDKAEGVATCAKVQGVLLNKTAKGWQPVEIGDSLPANSRIVALPIAEVISANKSIKVRLVPGLADRGPFPVLESSIVLGKSKKGFDLVVGLDRGIVIVSNEKKQGVAKLAINVAGKNWEIELLTPETELVFEVYGRHPGGGELFGNKPGESIKIVEEPTIDVITFVKAGKCTVNTGDTVYGLNSPPGEAVLTWDSISGVRGVDFLPKMPEGVRPLTEEEQKKIELICVCTSCIKDQPVAKVLSDLVDSDDPMKRKLGVIGLGATDHLPELINALFNEKNDDVREVAVIALRHWMGRGPGQAEKLFTAFDADKRFKGIKARTAMQLLDGFSSEDLQQPFTYQLLILQLLNPNTAIRQLTWWHFQRLAADASKVDYSPTAPLAQRLKAVAQLRKLIPPGQLPSRPSAIEKKISSGPR